MMRSMYMIMTMGLMILVSALLANRIVVAQEDHEHDPDVDFDYGDPDIEQLIKDFGGNNQPEGPSAGEFIQSVEPAMPVSYPRNNSGTPDYYAVFALADRRRNPMISENCYKEAWAFATKIIGGVEAAREHAGEHVEDANLGRFTMAEYLQEIHECKEFCGPLIARVLKCHIDAVTRNRHELILFGFNSDVVEWNDRSKIQTLVSEWRNNSNKRVLIEARASRTAGDPEYNTMLSKRRAQAVELILVNAGIPRDSIKQLAVGWESPQIQEWIADRYGYHEEFDSVGELQMNQSAIVVLY